MDLKPTVDSLQVCMEKQLVVNIICSRPDLLIMIPDLRTFHPRFNFKVRGTLLLLRKRNSRLAYRVLAFRVQPLFKVLECLMLIRFRLLEMLI